MKKTTGKRGRPRKGNAMTAAERMRAYRKRKRDAGLKSIRHWGPAEGAGSRQYSDHRILDARSLAMHCKIAQKITRDPELLNKAKASMRLRHEMGLLRVGYTCNTHVSNQLQHVIQ